MSIDNLYVDSTGSDNNSGSSEGSADASGTAGATDGTATVDLSGDTPDLSGVSVGDTIRINGETNGKNSSDIFEITAVDDGLDTVDVTPTPGTASGLTWAIGGAWATINRAMDIVGGSDNAYPTTVHVKASAAYTETINIDRAANNHTQNVVVEGYNGTPGDGGQITVDGEATRASGMTSSASGANFYVFKNIIFDDHTSHGVNLITADTITWKNCTFSNNSGNGALVDDYHRFEECTFQSNSLDGLEGDNAIQVIGCKVFDSGAQGVSVISGLVAFSIFFDNDSRAINFEGANDSLCAVINCTVDGNNNSSDGVWTNSVYRMNLIIINSVFYDMDGTGVTFVDRELVVSRNNLLNDNTANYSGVGAGTFTGEVTGAPQFVDEGNNDYRPDTGSPMLAAGFDGSVIENQDQGCEIGAHQSTGEGAGTAARNPGIRTGGRM